MLSELKLCFVTGLILKMDVDSNCIRLTVGAYHTNTGILNTNMPR